MWNFTSALLFGLVNIPVMAWLFWRFRPTSLSWWGEVGWVILGTPVGIALVLSIQHDRQWASGYAAASAVWGLIWLWHHTRTRRKRAAELIGAKSRALRDALVRKAREAGRPRRVLRPQPI